MYHQSYHMKLSYRPSVLNLASIGLIGYMSYFIFTQPQNIGGDGLSNFWPLVGIIAGVLGLIIDQIFQANIQSKARLFIIEIGLIMLCMRGFMWVMENN